MAKALYKFQEKGVEHLLSMPFGKPHSLLADEPGAGKTPTTIEAAKKSGCKNGLIICPPVIKEQWAHQMVAWGLCAEDEIQVLHGLRAELDNTPWKVLNYELAREPYVKRQLLEHNWHSLTLDEAHRCKTWDSQTTLAIFHKDHGIAKQAYWKWALSGTIMPNRPLELFPILKAMCPETIRPFDDYRKYIERFCGGIISQGKGASNIPELTERIQPFMLKRALRDVWRECPPVIENDVYLDVPYETHPEWATAMLYESTERRLIAEAKIPYTAAYVKQRLDDGVDKLVVFAYHRNVIEGLAKQLASYGVVKIYGGMTGKQRQEAIAAFQNQSGIRVVLAQIASAGEGLDGLQLVARELVEAEPEWSPGREDQAVRRILRLGQTRTVILTRLLVTASYEEVIAGANKRKRRVIDIVTKPNGGNFVMSIEANIERIASALERIAAASEKSGVPSPVSNVVPFTPPVTAPGVAAPNVYQQTTQPILPPAPAPAPVLQPPPAPPAAAQYGAPAPAPSPAAPAAAPGLSRKEFEEKVIATLQPLGAAGMQKLATLNQQFGIARLGELPEQMFATFLSMIA